MNGTFRELHAHERDFREGAGSNVRGSFVAMKGTSGGRAGEVSA